MARTIQALRQAVFSALTAPPLTYTVNAGAVQTLSMGSVRGMAPVDVPAPVPDPLVSVTVAGRGKPSLNNLFREVEIRVSVSTSNPNGGDDIVTELYGAVLARLESTDADGVNTLSRAATASTLASSIATIREDYSLPPAFDVETKRFYVTAVLRGYAA